MFLWAVYACIVTPLKFGFFEGHTVFYYIYLIGFVADMVILVYRDFLSYLKSYLVVDFLAFIPWEIISQACGYRIIEVCLIFRLFQFRKVIRCFENLEKRIDFNITITRLSKLIFFVFLYTHVFACIYFYIGISFHTEKSCTWLDNQAVSGCAYRDFKDINMLKWYQASIYFSIVTMSTVGYGDIHAIHTGEMAFTVIFVFVSMIFVVFLARTINSLVGKVSKAEMFRDRMEELIAYLDKNKLTTDTRNRVIGNMRLQYERNNNLPSLIEDIPVLMRATISQSLYQEIIANVPLFAACSSKFINEIVIRVQEEFFLKSEVIIEKDDAVDALYFVSDGQLAGVKIDEHGREETILELTRSFSFGAIAVLCDIPQPYRVCVTEQCRLLRLDECHFKRLLKLYKVDGEKVCNNLPEISKESNDETKLVHGDLSERLKNTVG